MSAVTANLSTPIVDVFLPARSRWTACAVLRRAGCASVICLALLAVTLPAHAGDQFRRLSEREIRTRIAGKDITDRAHWSMHFRSDGKLVGSESGSTWTGRWEVSAGKLCMTSPGGGKTLACYEAWMSGENIQLRINTDEGALNGIVAAHHGS